MSNETGNETVEVTVTSGSVKVTIETGIGVTVDDMWLVVKMALYGSGFHRELIANLVHDD